MKDNLTDDQAEGRSCLACDRLGSVEDADVVGVCNATMWVHEDCMLMLSLQVLAAD